MWRTAAAFARLSSLPPPLARSSTRTASCEWGRYSERSSSPAHESSSVTPVGFKSKVVSRRHCEFWCTSGQWYVKDVKSSSGTFLNHVRLSAPNAESRPYPVNDGDVVQLGIDFKGGEEVIFRCVKIRIECNRGWQKSLNSFNTSAHKRLLKAAGANSKGNNSSKPARDSDAASTNSSECSICLNPVAPCQALFVAPCSHVWHYKCVRNLIQGPNWPNFLCPNCRFVADLEADVEQPEDFGDLVEEATNEESPDSREGAGSEDDQEEDTDDVQQDRDRLDRERDRRGLYSDDDEEMADLAQSTSLQSSTHQHNYDENEAPTCLPRPSRSVNNFSRPGANNASSHPLTINPTSTSAHRRTSYQRSPSTELLGARSTTPTSSAQFALAAGVMSMSMDDMIHSRDSMPMTPRNDAGPFVLDGDGQSPPGPQTGMASRALQGVSEGGVSLDNRW